MTAMQEPTQDLTEAEKIAETFGIVLGAAAHGEHLTEDHMKSVAGRMRRVLLAAAEDEADAAAANERFSAAIEAGSAAVVRGVIDPEAAEAALDEMAEQLET